MRGQQGSAARGGGVLHSRGWLQHVSVHCRRRSLHQEVLHPGEEEQRAGVRGQGGQHQDRGGRSLAAQRWMQQMHLWTSGSHLYKVGSSS